MRCVWRDSQLCAGPHAAPTASENWESRVAMRSCSRFPSTIRKFRDFLRHNFWSHRFPNMKFWPRLLEGMIDFLWFFQNFKIVRFWVIEFWNFKTNFKKKFRLCPNVFNITKKRLSTAFERYHNDCRRIKTARDITRGRCVPRRKSLNFREL